MSGPFGGPFSGDEFSTPLAAEERDGLRQNWITYRHELNDAEQRNIALGAAWAFRSRRTDVLTEAFVRDLHRRMFGQVWDWAGSYRRTARNLGVDAWRIPMDVAAILDDTRYWRDHDTHGLDEIAVRLHHRLVSIHPFPNGNGRHTRMMSDLLIVRSGGERFSWGRSDLLQPGDGRTAYIDALRAADRHDMAPLLVFARS